MWEEGNGGEGAGSIAWGAGSGVRRPRRPLAQGSPAPLRGSTSARRLRMDKEELNLPSPCRNLVATATPG